MADFKNEFAWSWSRHRAFEECRRKYWLNHYGFWGGWRRDDPAREIYIQKRLNTRPQWLGSLVHEQAERLLKEGLQGRALEPDRAVERATRRAWSMIRESERGRYRDDPKRMPGFVEHYYGIEVSPEQWEADVSEAARQVAGLFDNPVFDRLLRVRGQIREIEELRQFVLVDVPIWVSLDVLVADGEGGFVVIDWKTGRGHHTESVAAQLAVYGAYVLQTYLGEDPTCAPPDKVGKIKGMYVNLRSGEREVLPLDPESLAQTVEQIGGSAAAMRAALTDVEENLAAVDDFPMLPEGDPACSRCPFRGTCGRA
ncbi:MAG: PD-(D/E)XK nuclease family protein [Deltaproteobacteria bacterium]|nr:MAG: PD-(D/E)XK nuclease family protein [Deltaproteobacteria bacterium]